MANCGRCGKELTFVERIARECQDCLSRDHEAFLAEHGNQPVPSDAAAISSSDKQEQVEAAVAAIMITTETAHNLDVVKRLDIITAECVFGMNIFKDIGAGLRDLVGGRNDAFQKTLRDARNTVMLELRHEAWKLGADAVVGVDLDYSEISGGGKSMMFLVASGTAVLLANRQD